tara:strand:- start:389 stop:568 length:180 start_codon:yes stop_codon:yes gene_type:complete
MEIIPMEINEDDTFYESLEKFAQAWYKRGLESMNIDVFTENGEHEVIVKYNFGEIKEQS